MEAVSSTLPSTTSDSLPSSLGNSLKKASFRLYFLAIDFLTAYGAWVAYYSLRKMSQATVGGSYFSLLYSGLTIAAFWLLVYAFCGFYKDVLRKSRTREFLYTIRICLIGALIFIGLFAWMLVMEGSDLLAYRDTLRLFTYYISLHLALTLAGKMALMTWSKRLLRKKAIHFRTLLIGSGQMAYDVYKDIEENAKHLGLLFVGYVDIESELNDHQIQGSLSYLGDWRQIEPVILQYKIEQVIIAIEKHEHATLQDIITQIEGNPVRTGIIPDIYQILLGSVKISQLFGTPLIEIKTDLMPVWQQVSKRLFDLMVSLSVLVLGFPFLAIIGLITKLTSKGPMFYRQERIGKGGIPFYIIKFRSMYIDAERNGPTLSSNHDPRVTPWGRIMRKTRLDEFPQFYNVLKGEMSIVGPRPERQHFIDQIVKVAPHYKHLNRVRPGITSLGQVKFGYAENVDQMVRRLKYDILYIENMSLAMDLRIIFYTVLTVLKGSGK